jgi:hypothetical protein
MENFNNIFLYVENVFLNKSSCFLGVQSVNILRTKCQIIEDTSFFIILKNENANVIINIT